MNQHTDWNVYRDPEAKHPFASSISDDRLVFVTGVAGRDPDGGLSPSAAEQARNCLRKIGQVLEASGSSLDEVVWIRPVISDRGHAAEVGAVYREFFAEPMPGAGALLIAGLIDPEMRVEFDVVAARGARRVPGSA